MESQEGCDRGSEMSDPATLDKLKENLLWLKAIV